MNFLKFFIIILMFVLEILGWFYISEDIAKLTVSKTKQYEYSFKRDKDIVNPVINDSRLGAGDKSKYNSLYAFSDRTEREILDSIVNNVSIPITYEEKIIGNKKIIRSLGIIISFIIFCIMCFNMHITSGSTFKYLAMPFSWLIILILYILYFITFGWYNYIKVKRQKKHEHVLDLSKNFTSFKELF